jgi:hypothetical protein
MFEQEGAIKFIEARLSVGVEIFQSSNVTVSTRVGRQLRPVVCLHLDEFLIALSKQYQRFFIIELSSPQKPQTALIKALNRVLRCLDVRFLNFSSKLKKTFLLRLGEIT